MWHVGEAESGGFGAGAAGDMSELSTDGSVVGAAGEGLGARTVSALVPKRKGGGVLSDRAGLSPDERAALDLELRRFWNDWPSPRAKKRVRAFLERLLASRGQPQQDTERLDWLVVHGDQLNKVEGIAHSWWGTAHSWWELSFDLRDEIVRRDTIRQAIDAARAAGKEQG